MLCHYVMFIVKNVGCSIFTLENLVHSLVDILYTIIHSVATRAGSTVQVPSNVYVAYGFTSASFPSTIYAFGTFLRNEISCSKNMLLKLLSFIKPLPLLSYPHPASADAQQRTRDYAIHCSAILALQAHHIFHISQSFKSGCTCTLQETFGADPILQLLYPGLYVY